MNPDSALLLSAADARRERRGCILLLQVPRNLSIRFYVFDH